MLDGSIQLIAADVPIRETPVPIQTVRRTLIQPISFINQVKFRRPTFSTSDSGYASRANSIQSDCFDEERNRALQEVLERELRKFYFTFFLSFKKFKFKASFRSYSRKNSRPRRIGNDLLANFTSRKSFVVPILTELLLFLQMNQCIVPKNRPQFRRRARSHLRQGFFDSLFYLICK